MEKKTLSQMICPVCGATSTVPVFPQYSGSLITSDSRVLPKGEIKNGCCKGCGLIFNARGTRGLTEDFYKDSYSLMLHKENAGILSFTGEKPITQAERTFQILREWLDIPATGSLFEIGAGKGGFLSFFNQFRPEWELGALEPSQAWETLSREIPSVKMFHGQYKDYPEEGKRFDLLAALGVLEHVENPLDMIRWSSGHLKADGYLFLRVPNFANNPNDLFCADHLSKLTPHTIRSLATAAGFEERSIKEAGVPLFMLFQKSGTTDQPLANVFDKNREIAVNNAEIAKKSLQCIQEGLRVAMARKENFGVFGLGLSGQFAPLYSDFKPEAITAYIDENQSMWGIEIHGKPVGGLDWIEKKKIRHIALALSPVYEKQVREKLSAFPVEIYSASSIAD